MKIIFSARNFAVLPKVSRKFKFVSQKFFKKQDRFEDFCENENDFAIQFYDFSSHVPK